MNFKEACDKLRNLPDREFDALMESWGLVRKGDSMKAKYLKGGYPEEDWYLTYCEDDGFCVYLFDGEEESFLDEFGWPIKVTCYWDLPEVPEGVE